MNFATPRGSRDDTMVLNIVVKEKATGSFNISVNERERAITLLTRMDRLRLTSARQRLKLLAAACFSCQLG